MSSLLFGRADDADLCFQCGVPTGTLPTLVRTGPGGVANISLQYQEATVDEEEEAEYEYEGEPEAAVEYQEEPSAGDEFEQ